MLFAIFLMTALTVGIALAIAAAFRTQLCEALAVRRFRKQLTKLEIVTSFWRACLPD